MKKQMNNNNKKKKILVIEDDESLRHALRDELDRNGFKVSEAETGEKGLNLIRKKKQDLVLLDLMLPKMPGEQVLKKMNEEGLTKKMPVIILTAKGDEANVNNCLTNLGASDYLIKSNYTLKGVINKINNLLKKNK